MAQDTLELRIGFRKLLIGFLVTLVPVNLVALYAVSESARQLEVTVGNRFKMIAQLTAARTTEFIHDRARDVTIMASDPAMVEAVIQANRSYERMSDEAVRSRIETIEASWPTPAADAVVKRILSTAVSADLRHHVTLDPRFLRFTATDERGATIAASHKTIDYFQGDEDYWLNIYNEGRGSTAITDAQYDVVTKTNYLGIGAPVLEPASNRFVGTLYGLIDIASVFPVIADAQVGGGGRALLVKDDGTVIRGPNSTLSMDLKSPEYAGVVDALQTLQGRQTGYLVSDLGTAGGPTIIGFADTGLKEDFEHLGWVVLVAQPVEEAFAPIRTTQRLIMAITALAFIAIVVAGVYFSLHRKGEIEEIEEEFHAPLVRD